MVAVVAGNGLGLFNTSANILGTAGVLGQGVLGQSPGRSYVNAATGNLILQFQDEQLSGRGADLQLLRTYNSQGQLSDGLGTGWNWDAERTVQLIGERGATGSLVKRTGGDGHVTDYQWDGTRYVSTEGDGAHDHIEYDAGAQGGAQWKWIDGSSQQVERYSASTGRIASQTDTSGNLIEFGYADPASGPLTTLTDHASGQQLRLTYTSSGGQSRVSQVDTFELLTDGLGRAQGTVSTTPIRQVEYTYDGGRLATVKTVLDPTAIPLTYYTTAYSYDPGTGLVSSITQGDGTSVSFTYVTDGSNRIRTVTDANGTQTFTYHAHSTDITVGDPQGHSAQTWTYTYDAATQQLTQIETPAPSGSGPRPTTSFHYDTAGNLDTVTDVLGHTVTYQYDAQGNRTRERDALGNTVSRTFDPVTNQLLTQTRYLSPDPNGSDEVLPSDPLITRYAYDERARVRFIVSAEGTVTENRYGTNGLLSQSLTYTGNRYNTSGLSPLDTLTEATLSAWVGSSAVDKTQVQQRQYDYDLRGNLSRETDFASANAAAVGALDATATVTDYIYDGHGELLHTIAVRGSAPAQSTILTSFTYVGQEGGAYQQSLPSYLKK